MPLTTSAQQILKNHVVETQSQLPPEFWDLMERYRSDLFNQAYACVGSVQDAEDVAQETFCEAFRRRDELAQVRSVGAWLRVINQANALDRLRGRRRESGKTARKQREAPARMATTGGFSFLELRESMAKSIEGLPEDLRAVVALRYWEHLSYDQIAQRLEIAPITVRRRLTDSFIALYNHPNLKPYLGTAPNAESSNVEDPGPNAALGSPKPRGNAKEP